MSVGGPTLQLFMLITIELVIMSSVPPQEALDYMKPVALCVDVSLQKQDSTPVLDLYSIRKWEFYVCFKFKFQNLKGNLFIIILVVFSG